MRLISCCFLLLHPLSSAAVECMEQKNECAACLYQKCLLVSYSILHILSVRTTCTETAFFIKVREHTT